MNERWFFILSCLFCFLCGLMLGWVAWAWSWIIGMMDFLLEMAGKV